MVARSKSALVTGGSSGIGLAIARVLAQAVISFTRSLNAAAEDDGVRATAISPGLVDTPMTSWSNVPGKRMIQPEDCAEVVRALLRLSPHARVPHVVIERLGS